VESENKRKTYCNEGDSLSGTLEGGPEMLQGQKKLYVCKMITGIELTHFYTRITPPRYYELH